MASTTWSNPRSVRRSARVRSRTSTPAAVSRAAHSRRSSSMSMWASAMRTDSSTEDFRRNGGYSSRYGRPTLSQKARYRSADTRLFFLAMAT